MKNLHFPGLPRVLVIDDEAPIRDGLKSLLESEGVTVETASDVAESVRRLENRSFDVVLLDLSLPEAGGLEFVPTLRSGPVPADVVILTGYGTVANTVEAMRHGATDVIEKPFTQDRILSVVRRCIEARQMRNELSWLQDRVKQLTATELIGLSPAIREVQSQIVNVAASPDTTVLITGGRGAGKELVARSIHERSSRRHGPFLGVNCAALSESNLEVRLFGNESGAFSDAEGRDGVLASAAGGTLYLDEIGSVSLTLQAKILRVMQERTYRRVGGVKDIHADVRILVGSSVDLRAAVDAGAFRDDLYYRLSVMRIDVPNLSERPEDVPLLAHYFLDQIGRQMGKSLSGFTEEALETLCEYRWPGNVRELRNVIERAAIICPSGTIDEVHLPSFTGGALDGSDEIERSDSITLEIQDRSIRALEGQLVARVLEDTSWNISKAASILGINRTTLYNKIRLHNLGERPNRSKVTL